MPLGQAQYLIIETKDTQDGLPSKSVVDIRMLTDKAQDAAKKNDLKAVFIEKDGERLHLWFRGTKASWDQVQTGVLRAFCDSLLAAQRQARPPNAPLLVGVKLNNDQQRHTTSVLDRCWNNLNNLLAFAYHNRRAFVWESRCREFQALLPNPGYRLFIPYY